MNASLRRTTLALAALAAIAAIAAVVVSRSSAVGQLGPQRIIVKGEPTVSDPVDSTQWVLRTIRHAPLPCLSAQHVHGRKNAGSCSRRATWATARLIEQRVPRTLVFGHAGPGVRRVTVSGPGGARIFELTRTGRTFLAVFSGRVPDRDLAVVATTDTGRHTTIATGTVPSAVAADPQHGPPWLANAYTFTGGPRRGQTCVHIGREAPRFGPWTERGVSRPICSSMAGIAYFFKVVRMQGRTVLTGVAKHSIVSVSARPLSGPAGTEGRQAAIERKNGAFVLAFDGAKVHTDGLVVTIHTRQKRVMFPAQRAMNLGFTTHVPADLLRDGRSGKGKWLYHGVRITGDAAARHHLKCSSDLRLCDDSMSKLLATALHQGTPGTTYRIPDSTVCPLVPFGPLPRDAGKTAAAEVLRELPALYGGAKSAGAKVVSVAPATRAGPRGNYARVKCGRTAQRRSFVVQLHFPAMEPSASMSQGTVLVGSFWGHMRVWALLH